MQGVYEIVNLADGKATAYVGSSADIKRRWEDHKARLRRGVHSNEHLQRAWDKYSEAAFEWSVIEEIQDMPALLEREQYWLDRYLENPDTCYNIALDATAPTLGRHHTEEAKEKISAANRGELNPMWGRSLSKEHRRKISEALSGELNPMWGKCFSEEHRRKLSEASKGRHPTEETRRKMSEARRGRHCTEETRRKMGAAKAKPYPAFIHRETGAIIVAGCNLSAMCERRGLDQRHMWSVMHGKRKSHKGWALL